MLGMGRVVMVKTCVEVTFGGTGRLRELRAWADVDVWHKGCENMNGLGGEPPCLLLLSTPLSHVVAVMSNQKGLAESQKLHNRALKPVGCCASPPSLSLFSF